MSTNSKKDEKTPISVNQKMNSLTSSDMNKKIQILQEELNGVHSKLNEFSQELSDYHIKSYDNNKSSYNNSEWSSMNMTTKMYKKVDSVDSNTLPDRIFVKRDSLLTELFKITHVRTIRHIFMSIMIILALQVVCNDLMDKGKIDLNFILIRWAFGKLSIVFFTWLYMKFFTTCVVYCAFHYWSKSRVDYLVTKSKKNDDFKSNEQFNKYDLTWLAIFISYLIGFITIPGYVVITNSLPPASAMIILMEQVRLLMKTYAFVRSNIPRALENGLFFVQNGGQNFDGEFLERKTDKKDVIVENSKVEKETNSGSNSENEQSLEDDVDSHEKILCPEFSKYLYFLFAPTLVYRDRYPRTSRINWNTVAENFAQVVGCVIYVNYIFVRFCIPVFQDFNKEHVTMKSFIRSILNCHLAGTLLLLIGFFSFLHCWLNMFAEMLCFGDRMFYKDWWNSTNFQSYYRTWNCVVHDFLYTYIYKDTYYLVGKKYKVVSQFAIFFISAIFHEYVLTLALGFFYPVLFIMFGAIGFLCMFLRPQTNSNFWNFVLWIGLQIGLGGLMCLYSIEWFARQNCNPSFESKIYDYLIPRSFTCGMENGKYNLTNSVSKVVNESIKIDL